MRKRIKRFTEKIPFARQFLKYSYFEVKVADAERLLLNKPEFSSLLYAISVIKEGIALEAQRYYLITDIFKACFPMVNFFDTWKRHKDVQWLYFFYGVYVYKYVGNSKKSFIFILKVEKFINECYEKSDQKTQEEFKNLLIEILIFLRDVHKNIDSTESKNYAKKLVELGYIEKED